MPSSATPLAKPPSGIVKLLLVGAGPAHLQLLARLARHRPVHLDVTVLTPYPHLTHHGMAMGMVAGRYGPEACQIPLSPWIKRSGARLVPGRPVRIDTVRRRVHHTVRSQDTEPVPLPYDLLSMDMGSGYPIDWLDQHLPGARQHALALHPIEHFVRLWRDLWDLAESRALSVAVVGGGAAGCETALALAQGLGSTRHRHRLSLITGTAGVLPGSPEGLRQRTLRQLKRQNITLLPQDCVGMAEGEVRLSGGGRLQCDAPLLAIGGQAVPWLADSGLALSEDGRVRVNACQQSVSHPEVFAAGDMFHRDNHGAASQGEPSCRAVSSLGNNLIAAATGAALRPYPSLACGLQVLSCGAGHAIAQWGPLHTEGAWVWAWKDRIDRAWMRRWQLSDDTPSSTHASTRL